VQSLLKVKIPDPNPKFIKPHGDKLFQYYRISGPQHHPAIICCLVLHNNPQTSSWRSWNVCRADIGNCKIVRHLESKHYTAKTCACSCHQWPTVMAQVYLVSITLMVVLQFFSMYPAMGIVLYHCSVMANLARICGNQL